MTRFVIIGGSDAGISAALRARELAPGCEVTLIVADRFPTLGTTSHKQGRIAGENAVGGTREFQGSVGTQSVRLFDLVVARAGLHDADARAAGLSPRSVDSEHWDHKVYYPGARRMLIRITGERDTGRLLGAQIIGAYGTEVSKRVDIVAAALHQDMRVEDLNDLDLSYTPPLRSPWDPVQMAAQAWVQHWRQGEGRGV